MGRGLGGWVAVALAAAVLPAPARPAVPVTIYPPTAGPGVADEALTDVASLVESALRARARHGVLVPASPLYVAATCGQPPQDACLGRVAGAGRLLAVRVKRAGGVLGVTLTLVDGAGRRTPGVGFGVDPMIMSSTPAQQAIATLEGFVTDGAPPRAQPQAKAQPQAAPPPPRPAPDLRAPPPAPPPAKGQALRLREAPPPPPPPSRQAVAGRWTLAAGLALVAAGGAVGWLDRSLADDLAAKNRKNALSPSDRAAYDRVKTYNRAATALYLLGGATAATGLGLWIFAPAGAGVQGSF